MDLEEGGSSTASPRNSCCARLGERRVPRAPRHVQCHLPNARGIDKRHPIPKIANALSIRHKRKAKCNAPSGAIRVRRRQHQFSPANRQACERARTTGGGPPQVRRLGATPWCWQHMERPPMPLWSFPEVCPCPAQLNCPLYHTHPQARACAPYSLFHG